MALRDDIQALDIVSATDKGPYCLLAQVDVKGLDIVTAREGLLSFYGEEASGGPAPPPEGQLSRIYPGMVRVYPGVARKYPL